MISSDELLPDEFDELEELEDDLEEMFEEEAVGMEEPPISERDKEKLAQEVFQEQKREMELKKLEREARHKKKRKVRNPKAELLAMASVVIITLIIAGSIMYIALKDYQGDRDSSYDEIEYNAIKEENLWFKKDNRSISSNNETGYHTGKDAAKDYKESYRMDGPYSFEFSFFELNWAYYTVIAIIAFTGPNGIVRRRQINKLKAKEAKFPDFIRDLAEFWKGGLSMKVAVDTLAKGEYGALDEEVEFMATQLSWGIAFSEVLRMFLDRVHTGLIERSIALIEEANKAGGKISDILLNVAHDAQEIKMLDRQREGTMKSYIFVTFISFFIYVIIIVIMSYVFLPAIADSTEDLDVQGSIGNVKIQSFDPTFIALLFFSSVIIQSVGGGVNAGIMGEGNLGASLWYITLFTIVGVLIFQFFGVSIGLG